MKFILTKELGKLARWLRIIGFDARYFTQTNPGTLIIEALRENRIVVTKRKKKIDSLEKQTVHVHSDEVGAQLKEVITQLKIAVDPAKMFSRCVLCNEPLCSVTKEAVKEKIPPYVYTTKDIFMQCSVCGRIYWEGSHWGNIKECLGEIV